MSKIFVKILVALSLTLFYTQSATAYYLIYDPYVEYGETEVELYVHHTTDSNNAIDGSQQYVLELARGYTPKLFLEAKVTFDKFSDSNLDSEAVAVEAVYQFTEQGEYAVDVGFLAEVVHSLDNNRLEEIEFGALLARDFGASTLTANIIAEYENVESKMEGELKLQWKWRHSVQLEPAIELYSNEYVSLAGPVIMGKIKSGRTKLGYQAGWLTALDDASPDNTLKFVVEYEF